MPGTLCLRSPAEVISGVGGMVGGSGGVELFSDEIATLLSDHSLYRESSYQLLIPYDATFIPRVLGYVRGSSSSADPWGYLRFELSVSYLKDHFLDRLSFYLAYFMSL